MRRICLAVYLCLASTLWAEDDGPFLLDSVEKKFSADVAKAQADVTRAEAELVKAKKAAGAVRLKAYKDRLAEITKSGDFDKAQQVKARIESLENDQAADTPAGKKASRIPKDATKFGGHSYAVIKELVPWHVAKARCEELGGHLVCINNAKEQLFVAGLCGKTLTSIGATDELKEGVCSLRPRSTTIWNWIIGWSGTVLTSSIGTPAAEPNSFVNGIDKNATMKCWTRIIVEELQGHWSARFKDLPYTSFGGEFPAEAMRRLLDATGEQFDETDLREDSEAMRDGHLEFYIAYRDRVLMSVPFEKLTGAGTVNEKARGVGHQTASFNGGDATAPQE